MSDSEPKNHAVAGMVPWYENNTVDRAAFETMLTEMREMFRAAGVPFREAKFTVHPDSANQRLLFLATAYAVPQLSKL